MPTNVEYPFLEVLRDCVVLLNECVSDPRPVAVRSNAVVGNQPVGIFGVFRVV